MTGHDLDQMVKDVPEIHLSEDERDSCDIQVRFNDPVGSVRNLKENVNYIENGDVSPSPHLNAQMTNGFVPSEFSQVLLSEDHALSSAAPRPSKHLQEVVNRIAESNGVLVS